MDIELFKEIGFTERETKVYFALIELGQSTAGPIAAKAKLSHTKVYETLERLINKGLVAYSVVSKTKHFQASDPKEILRILDERRQKMLSEIGELQTKAKFAQAKQETVIHEGHKALRALFNRIVDEAGQGDFYYAFALKQDYRDSTAPIFFTNIHNKLAEKKVIDKAIAHEEIRKDISWAYANNKNIQLRFIRSSTPIGLVIIKNKVIQLTWGELPTAIETTSIQIHQQYKSFFEELWKSARK
jgi:HTH-type transcriptional regulator, sugar sensing transcriptional regulator